MVAMTTSDKNLAKLSRNEIHTEFVDLNGSQNGSQSVNCELLIADVRFMKFSQNQIKFYSSTDWRYTLKAFCQSWIIILILFSLWELISYSGGAGGFVLKLHDTLSKETWSQSKEILNIQFFLAVISNEPLEVHFSFWYVTILTGFNFFFM